MGDIAGKRLHSYYKQQAIPAITAAADPGQCGGFAGNGTDTASLIVRCYFELLHQRRQSGGVLFVDLTSAFASVLRQPILTMDMSDESIAVLFRTFEIQSTIAEFTDAIRAPSAAAIAGLDPHLAMALECTLEATWFTVQGVSSLSHT